MMLGETMEGFADGRKTIQTYTSTPPTYQSITDDGFRALWIVFIIMALSTIIFALLSWNIPVAHRLYHVLTTLITLTAALSYFAMASGHGASYHCTAVKEYHKNKPNTHHDVCRQVLWARYVDCLITTPLILLDLCLLAGVDGAHTLMAIVAGIIMALGGLFGAFGYDHTAQMWGWYAIACIAYLFVIWHVAIHGTRTVKIKGSSVGRLFGSLTAYTLIVWIIYPIVWGVAGGTRRTSVDAEVIAYAVLDVLAKPVFGFWLLLAHRRTPEADIELDGYWSLGLGAEGRIRVGDEEGNEAFEG